MRCAHYIFGKFHNIISIVEIYTLYIIIYEVVSLCYIQLTNFLQVDLTVTFVTSKFESYVDHCGA